MQIRNTFLLAVLLLIVSKVQANGASLNSLIEELAPIARLTNGIAIETELSADANKMNDVVAEFLRVGSGDDVAKLKELRVDEVAKELGELYATVEKVPELNVDMAALADTFKALEQMKQSSKVLGNKNLTDPSDELQKDLDLARSARSFHFTALSELKKIADELKFIKATGNAGSVDGLLDKHLGPLDASLKTIDGHLSYLRNFETNFEAFLKLQNMSEKLQDFGEMAKPSELFIYNFKMLSSMSTKLSEVHNGIGFLKTVIDKKNTVPELANDLSKTSEAVKRLASTTAAVKLTAGFSGGVGDLKLVFDDLKSGRLKSVVAKGKDTKDLQKSLGSLVNIHRGLDMLVKVWSQLSIAKRTDSPEKLASILADILKSNQKSSDIAVLANSLGPLKNCFKDLKLPNVVPDFKNVVALDEFAKKLGPRIEVLKQFLNAEKAMFEAISAEIFLLLQILNPINSAQGNTVNVWNSVWNDIRNFSKIDYLIEQLNRIHGAYENVKAQSPFDTVQEAVDLSVITAVLKISNGTNLDVMLFCLQKNSYDANLMGSTLNFGKSVQVMKSKKTEYNSTQTFLTELSRMKSELQKVEQLMKPTQQPKPRRRRAPNQKSLANLKNAQTIATDLGKGVQVLREFAKILENEASVQVAVNADDGLKNAISAIPGVQSVWTDENRKGMGKMVVDLKELDKFAGSVKMDNMTSLWQIFDEAQKTDGVVGVDAKVFDDPISTVLAASSDPKIKGASGDFKNLGALDLDFAQHKINLKAASFTLQPLQQFFDDYFGNTKTSGGTVLRTVTVSTSDSETLYTVFGVLGGIGLVAGVGAVGYYLIKRRKRKEQERLEKLRQQEKDELRRKLLESRWADRERHWIYEEFYDDDDCLTNLPLAVADQKIDTAKTLIADGCILDNYYEGFAALHEAVDNGLPEMVELLIISGADRSLVCHHKLTAYELIDKRLKDETFKEKWAGIEECRAVFKKYEKQEFKPKVRDLLPLHRFDIKIVSTDKKMEKVVKEFQEKFDQYLTKIGSMRITHIVLDTDENGVYDFDKAKAATIKWQKEETARRKEMDEKMTDLERVKTPILPNIDDPDNLESFEYFFSNVVVVKTSWLVECLTDKKNLHRDYDNRITKVRHNKKVYETVDEWKKWIRKRAIPPLYKVELGYGFYRVVDDPHQTSMGPEVMARICKNLGCSIFPLDQLVNRADITGLPRPLWFPKMFKYWFVHSQYADNDLKEEIGHRNGDGKERTVKVEEFEKKSVVEFFEFLLSLNGSKGLEITVGPSGEEKKPVDAKTKSTSKTTTA